MAPSKLIHDAINNDTYLGHLIVCHQYFYFFGVMFFCHEDTLDPQAVFGVTAVYLFKGIKQQAEWTCCGT